MLHFSDLGLLLAVIGIITVPVAALLLLVGKLSRSKRLGDVALYMLIGASSSLLVSFSLCSMANTFS